VLTNPEGDSPVLERVDVRGCRCYPIDRWLRTGAVEAGRAGNQRLCLAVEAGGPGFERLSHGMLGYGVLSYGRCDRGDHRADLSSRRGSRRGQPLLTRLRVSTIG
jgi:hypothetical protein